MKRQYLFSFQMLLLSVFSGYADSPYRGPSLHDAGLLKTDQAIALDQADFDSGTYRITEPGYYFLKENIVFDPIAVKEAQRTDKPTANESWFAAISVECDNVVIDLNTKTLESSENFVNNQVNKVFSLIELNNSPFPHLIFAFAGDTEVKSANAVTIKNGTLGLSSHHGIHGNNNSNVYVYDLVIKDWEVAGISLNALKSAEIKHITISGVEHKVPFTGLTALLDIARINLQTLVDQGDQNAQAYLDDLMVVINDDNQNGKNHPTGTHDGNAYGIFINRTVDVGPIVTHCGDTTSNSIVIDDVTVTNMNAAIIETVGIADTNNKRLKGHTFGVLRWQDAYPSGTFAPNAILKAQVYAANQLDASLLPAGFADNILSNSPDESVFKSHAQPIFEGDFAGHTNKGVFGIRVDCGHGVTVKNCTVMGISNEGELGTVVSDIAGSSGYELEQKRYAGNDAYGISLAACHNCTITDCFVSECHSKNGHVFGVSLMNHSDANHLVNCVSSDHYADLDITNNSTVNPPSSVFGFHLANESHANRLFGCVSQNLASPRSVYGFYLHELKDTLVKEATSSSHRAHSSQHLSDKDEAKHAIGFVSLSSVDSRFDACTASMSHCDGEKEHDEKSQSRCAGFWLTESENGDKDRFGSVSNSVADCHNGGAGKSYGIWIDDADGVAIRGNRVVHAHGDTSKSNGYGICKNNEGDHALIIENVAYGNDKEDYKIDLKKGDFPVVELSYRDMKEDLHPFYNVSFKID